MKSAQISKHFSNVVFFLFRFIGLLLGIYGRRVYVDVFICLNFLLLIYIDFCHQIIEHILRHENKLRLLINLPISCQLGPLACHLFRIVASWPPGHPKLSLLTFRCTFIDF